MKITFVLPFASLSGGVRVIATYARHLSEAGHEVTVVSRPQRIRGSALRAFLIGLRNRLTGQPARAPTPLLDFLGARHVVLDRFRPVRARDLPDADAVVATWWETARSVAEMPESKGRKFYLIQDYEIFDNLPSEKVTASYQLPLRKIAVSGYIRDALAEHHGVTDITVVPNAVDIDQFETPPRDRGTPFTVGFLYHAHPRKQSELAIEAVKRARDRLPELRVIAFGRAAPAERFGFPDWIEYRQSPPQDGIPGIYAACDAWLFTSRHEGFGLPLLEAMACRTPVLATPAGAARDLIDGQNGEILDHDPEAFAEAILRMAALDPEAWRARSDAAHRTAQAHTWPQATARLLEVLRA